MPNSDSYLRHEENNFGQASTLSFFTICAQNYLAFASVLGRSLSQSKAGTRLTVFLLDGVPDQIEGLGHLDMKPANLVLDPQDWDHRRAYYDVLELSTSIKPACFLKMMQDQNKFVVYLDPDIFVFKPLDEVARAFKNGQDAVVTPHTVQPFPTDNRRPDDLEILRAGIYNLGFAAFRCSESSINFLMWWDKKLRTLCFSDKSEGVFTDQKWINFLPAYEINVTILKHPGYNMAYWNLHERDLLKQDNEWFVRRNRDQLFPLIFFHYSGFNPDLEILSKYSDLSKKNTPNELMALISDYAKQLKSFRFNDFSTRRMPVVRFHSGEAWDLICRKLYQTAFKQGLEIDNPLEDVRFINWISAPESGDYLPKYLRVLLLIRPELALMFDGGRDITGLLSWIKKYGSVQIGIDPKLMSRLEIGDLGGSKEGINYVGYLSSHMGVAQAARGYLESIAKTDIPTKLHDISKNTFILDGEQYPQGSYSILSKFSAIENASYNLTIIHVNADMLPETLSLLNQETKSTFKIGIWAWESLDFPEGWCDRFDLVDEVWVASNFMAEAIRAKATIPVIVMPYVVDVPHVDPDNEWLRSLTSAVTADEFLFLFQFDALSIPYRKNPEATIKAFVEAFSPDQPVRLIVKVLNAYMAEGLIDSLKEMAAGHRVSFLDLVLNDTERFRLLATIDCFVSLHRAEGFGLSLAEAMAYGKPVIATNWSGNTDFMDSKNAALVSFTLKELKRDYGPYASGTLWAEPDIADAARLMRKIYISPKWRRELGDEAARQIPTLLGADVVGGLLKSRLERIYASERFRIKTKSGAHFMAQGTPRTKIIKYILKRPFYFLMRFFKAVRYLMTYGVRATIERTSLHMK